MIQLNSYSNKSLKISKGGILKLETQLINEQTVMIYFNNEISEQTYEQVRATVEYIKEQSHPEITEIIPSYRAILIYFDNTKIKGNELLEN